MIVILTFTDTAAGDTVCNKTAAITANKTIFDIFDGKTCLSDVKSDSASECAQKLAHSLLWMQVLLHRN